MTWQENVKTIVMLCGLTEDGRLMCDIYWPENNKNHTEKYDYLQVKMLKIIKLNDFYWERKFEIKNTLTGEKR